MINNTNKKLGPGCPGSGLAKVRVGHDPGWPESGLARVRIRQLSVS